MCSKDNSQCELSSTTDNGSMVKENSQKIISTVQTVSKSPQCFIVNNCNVKSTGKILMFKNEAKSFRNISIVNISILSKQNPVGINKSSEREISNAHPNNSLTEESNKSSTNKSPDPSDKLTVHLSNIHSNVDNNISNCVHKSTDLIEDSQPMSSDRLIFDCPDVKNKSDSSYDNLFLLADLSHQNPVDVSIKNEDNVSKKSSKTSKDLHCSYCSKLFPNSCYLERHILSHTKEKPFKCDICNKGFTQKGNLTIHYKTHSNFKPYICRVCDKGFTLNSGLKVHLMTHSEVKPHTCSVCKKGFTSKVFLERHFRIHSQEKPFVCNVCNLSFTQKSNLKAHILLHSENSNNHHCKHCCRKYLNLSKHLKKVHGE